MSKGAPAGGMESAWRQFEMRAYQIAANGKFVGKGSSRPKRCFRTPACSSKAFAVTVRSSSSGRTRCCAGDVVAVSGRREVLVNMLQTATEVEDRELLDVPAEAVDVVVTNKRSPARR